MKIEQIANDINKLYDSTDDSRRKNIKTLIDNISTKNASLLMEDIYANKRIKNNDDKHPDCKNNPYHTKPSDLYGMPISLATILYKMTSDEIYDVLRKLSHVNLKAIKECSEKIMQCDSLYSFILRRNTLIKRYNLTGSDYILYEFKLKDLFEICQIYSKRYDLSKDLEGIEFYKNNIAIMFDIEKSELCRNGKNKNLFDHFEKCINSYAKIKNKKNVFYVTQQ